MSGISVRPAPLLDASYSCEEPVASQVDVAERALADAEGAPAAARMGSMVSAESARSCIDGWQETLRQASTMMHVLSTKLRSTAVSVRTADEDSAGRYVGPVPELPDISVNIDQ